MKKIMLTFAILALIFLGACSNGKQTDIQDVTDDNPVTTEAVLTEKEEAPGEYDDYDWGMNLVPLFGINKNNESQAFHVSFPTDTGYTISYGRASKSKDKTFVVLGAQTYDCEFECNSVEDVPEAFNSQLVAAAEDKCNDSSAGDFSFNIESKEKTELAGLPACRFEGTHTFTMNDKTFNQYFAAYSVELSNGAYIYWLVFDDTEDQSIKDVVIYDADKMATTFAEE